jgi:hypothetical protein
MTASELDLTYDEFVADEKLKHGTKYERLAARLGADRALRLSDLAPRNRRLRAMNEPPVDLARYLARYLARRTRRR